MKNIQITEELFMLLVRYHLLGDSLCEDEISQGIEQKLDTIISRNLYTQYKTSPTKEEQEMARIEYLDRKGYHKDFRW